MTGGQTGTMRKNGWTEFEMSSFCIVPGEAACWAWAVAARGPRRTRCALAQRLAVLLLLSVHLPSSFLLLTTFGYLLSLLQKSSPKNAPFASSSTTKRHPPKLEKHRNHG